MTNPPITPFPADETARIQAALNTKLEPQDISYRPSPAGNVAYVEGWRSFNLANDVFGFNGWSSEILSLTTDFMDVDEASGKVSVGVSCMVRVFLRDGTFHDDIGYGSSEGLKSKAASLEKAKKEAVTDAMKRALRVYGNKLGNCAYDKVFLKEVKNVKHCSTNVTSSNNGRVTAGDASGTNGRSVVAPNSIQRPPPDFKPTWQPARSALAVSNAANANTDPNVHLHMQLHSDDFDALITEADLYDLEMQTNN